MRHPFQCLAICSQPGGDGDAILLAACGPQLHALSLRDGELLSSWPESPVKDDSDSSAEIITTSADNGRHPHKRRKISSKSASADAEVSVGAITRLAVAHNGRHVVATTGEDKSVHVFEVDKGIIKHMSVRHVPKRPSAVAVTPDDEQILCGDKFGDVYSLPLLATPTPPEGSEHKSNGHTGQDSSKPYRPSASNITVHSARNLKALENQMKHQSQQTTPKEAMDFEHELLLGHVSMLTDIATTTVPAQTGRRSRSYILTADRDEHIRISRGPPQSHIIENYCLGHTQFISKLCLPQSRILVSGGGDSELRIWDWQKGQLLSKLPIGKAVRDYWNKSQHSLVTKSEIASADRRSGDYGLEDDPLATRDGTEGDPYQQLDPTMEQVKTETTVAVSGILGVNHDPDNNTETPPISIVVICEAVPAVFKFTMPVGVPNWPSKDEWDFTAIRLPGNPLSLALHGRSLFVSIDHIHKGGTTEVISKASEEANGSNPDSQRIHLFSVHSSTFDRHESGQGSEALIAALCHSHSNIGPLIKDNAEDVKKLRDLIYCVENMRKRAGLEED